MSKPPRNPVQTSVENAEIADRVEKPFRDRLIWVILTIAVLAVYAQVSNFDFTTYDDPLYAQDTHVQEGLTTDSIKWAFTSVVSNNWIPVTLLSHVLDGEFFGQQSGMHHMTNVVIHILATLLLFTTLRRATGARWPSALVAFLFALHPLHVGSVAWIAERKDVVSAFFWFLALYAYVRYVQEPGNLRYVAMCAAFCAGLLAKPMLVTFPFVLLLFDLWPLGRTEWRKLVMEKLPLLGLSVIISIVTYVVQKSTGAVLNVPFDVRLQNALLSYVDYLKQTFWPADFAVIYPYNQSLPGWQVGVAAGILLVVTAVAILTWRSHRYLAIGWFWYLGTLVPVIGLVQVGLQSRADRYTYIPLVGVFVMIAWGLAELVERWPAMKRPSVFLAAAACVVCMLISWAEVRYWKNSETLFQHAIDVTQNNWAAQYNLGHYLMDVANRVSDAIPHFEESVRINPDYAESRNNLGAALMNTGHAAESIPQFEAAVRLKPDFADAHFNLGLALSKITGRAPDAIREYEAALRLNPNLEQAHTNLGVLLVGAGRTEEAVQHLEAAVRLHPDYRNERNLGAVLSTLPGRQSDAAAHLREAERLQPAGAKR
jgi:tetratricopeptide (TPR) repeat protein